MRALLLLLSLTACASLRALPESLLSRLFDASAVTAGTEGSWQLCGGRPPSEGLRVTAFPDGSTETRTDCPPHPNRLAEATMTRTFMPADSAGRSRLRLAYTLRPITDRPSIGLSVTLFAAEGLPPCSVRPWGRRLALVSDAGDWHIIADSPDATFTVSEGESPRIVLSVPDVTLSPGRSVTLSVTVGDGPLPPPDHE